MNVFDLRDRLTGDYSDFVRSFIHIRDDRIREAVQAELQGGLLWPDPLIQLNPSFEPGEWVDELVAQGVLHDECKRIFRIKPEPGGLGQPLRLHRHFLKHGREAKLIDGVRIERDDPQSGADSPPLEKEIGAYPGELGNSEDEVNLILCMEFAHQ